MDVQAADRVNVYLPDDLAQLARAAGLNLSGVTQQALRRVLRGRETDRWIAGSIAFKGRRAERGKSLTDAVVIDASAVVETLLGTAAGVALRARLRGCELHAPAHLDAEVLSAFCQLHRAAELDTAAVGTALTELAVAPIARHPLAGLLAGAWEARERLRLVDALYVQLASTLGSLPLLTTDQRLARASTLAELIGPG